MMKKFLLKTILLLSVVLIPFLLVEGVISYRLNNNFVVTLHSDWHALEGHNSDILFIGNSRIWTCVNTETVDDYTHAKSENLAQDGQGINVLWYKFKAYLKVNKVPKEIYVLADLAFLEKRHDLYRFDRFQPYLFMDRYDLGQMKEYDEYRISYKYLPLLAVREHTIDFITGKSTKPDSIEQKRGFTKFDMKWEGGLRWDTPPSLTIFDTAGIAYLDTFKNYCEQNDIRCYFIATPMSYPTYRNIEHYDMFKNYLWDNMGITFSDFNGKRYDDSTLFIDHRHLNAKGSDVFMQQMLADTTLFRSFR